MWNVARFLIIPTFFYGLTVGILVAGSYYFSSWLSGGEALNIIEGSLMRAVRI